MVQKNLLFYSNQCKYCKELAELLSKYNIIDNFIKICVDDPNLKLPTIVTSVPFAVMKDLNKVLEGDDIFKYIKNIYEKKELNGYNSMEMGSYSDGFSFVTESDDNIEKGNNSSLNQTFFNANLNCNDIITPNEDESNFDSSKKLEELVNSRTKDDTVFNSK
jgi:glutaredoxin-related protein